MKIQKSIIGLSLAAFVMLSSGCSSSSDAKIAQSVQPIKKSGVAIDGEISGATVCVNGNNNNTCDAGEDSTTTNLSGEYTLTTNQEGPLLLVGGKDMGTGKAFTGTLTAPANAKVITPLTSMITAMMDDDTSAEKAEITLKQALGISNDVDLTTYNPFEQADANDNKALAVLAAQAQIQTLVHASSATIASASDSKEIVDVMDSVTKSLAQSLKATAVANPSAEVTITADMVATATKDAAAEVFKEDNKAQVAAKSSAESMAAYSVSQSNVTKTSITEGGLNQAVTNLNASMILANDSLEGKATEATQAVLTKMVSLSPETLATLATATDVNDGLANSNITPTEIVVDENALKSALSEKTADAEQAATNADAARLEAATKTCTDAGGSMLNEICHMPKLPTGSAS